MADKIITVGYWDCRARVGVLSLLLDYCKIPYKLRLYPHSKFDEWGAKYKHELGADFPNLPYLINGDKIVTESLAMIRHIVNLGGRQDLLGKNLDDQTQVDTCLNVAKDIFEMVDVICYRTDFETEKNKLFSTSRVKDKLTRFNKFLEGKEWICGGYLTVADFYLFEDLDFIHDMDSSKLEPYPNLVNFRKRFLELPEIQAHRQTENFIARWLPYEAVWTNVPGHNEKPQKKVVLGYMKGRVLGQIPRHLLAYCKIPHEAKKYVDREDWEKEKETLGFDFPNLPYLIHGDLKLTESLAVYEYIPTINGHYELNGLDDSAKLQIKMLTGVINDLKSEVFKLMFSTPKESYAEVSEKSWSQGILKDKLIRLNKYLGDKEYLCGKITVVDFVLFNILDVLKELDEAKLSEFSGLVGLYKRFAEIPEIKSYRESGEDVKLWIPQGVEK